MLYDQLADRWFVTQFSLPNYDSNTGPSFQCVAVSKTGDPTGAYNLYDFQYSAVINDYGKFGVWPDAYYASFNNFSATSSQGANVCAYDRAKMLAGDAGDAAVRRQVGALRHAAGEPRRNITAAGRRAGLLRVAKSGTSISLYKFHVDWTTPANTAFTGPTNLTVASYTQLGSAPQQSPGQRRLASLGDRPMFHLSYRNFGTVESLVFNHSVTRRTALVRDPLAQRHAGRVSAGNVRARRQEPLDGHRSRRIRRRTSRSATASRRRRRSRRSRGPAALATDAAGTMGQGETLVQHGAGVETGTFSDGSTADRWGDYSNMSVDPTDDCTFWYTQEYYPSDGVFTWDTGISYAKFANCGKNDFSISLDAGDPDGDAGRDDDVHGDDGGDGGHGRDDHARRAGSADGRDRRASCRRR